MTTQLVEVSEVNCATAWSSERLSTYPIANAIEQSERQFRWASTLTKDTSVGRRAFRAIIAKLPELRSALDDFRLGEEDAFEVIDELTQRLDEDSGFEMPSQISGLRLASRWSGVSLLGQEAAHAVNSILAANWSAVAEIRLAHIPPSVNDFV